jgi:S-adenosylmethionine decarboxylase
MNQANEPFTGNHAIANFIDCTIDMTSLSAAKVKQLIEELCRRYSLQLIGGFYHDFDDKGALTSVSALTESHIAIHTWPELSYVTLDVYLCDYSRDNRETTLNLLEELRKFFAPKAVYSKVIKR